MSLFLSVCSLFGLTACGDEDPADNTIHIYMPDGAPALAMSKLMYENNQFSDEIDYTVVSSSNIANYILDKSADMAVIPVNMATKILGDGTDYKVVATLTNGNLYIVGNKNINGLEDLKGEVIGVIGQGNVPDLNLKYLLTSNSIEYEAGESSVADKVALRYFADASNLIPMLKQNQLDFGLLPEPAVSKLMSMTDDFEVELDMQTLWLGGAYPQAVLVAKTTLINEKNSLIESMITELDTNEMWAINNPANAVNAINNNLAEGVVASLQNTITGETIQRCNIDIISTKLQGEKNRIKGYWANIKTISPNAIGDYSDNIFW